MFRTESARAGRQAERHVEAEPGIEGRARPEAQSAVEHVDRRLAARGIEAAAAEAVAVGRVERHVVRRVPVQRELRLELVEGPRAARDAVGRERGVHRVRGIDERRRPVDRREQRRLRERIGRPGRHVVVDLALLGVVAHARAPARRCRRCRRRSGRSPRRPCCRRCRRRAGRWDSGRRSARTRAPGNPACSEAPVLSEPCETTTRRSMSAK